MHAQNSPFTLPVSHPTALRSHVTKLTYPNHRDTQAAITSYIAICGSATTTTTPSIDSGSCSRSTSPAVHPIILPNYLQQSSHVSNIVPSRAQNDRDIDREGSPRIDFRRVWLPAPSQLISDFPCGPGTGPGSCLAASALVGTSSAAVTGGPVDAMVAAIDALHGAMGLPWWATIALTAVGAAHYHSFCMLQPTTSTDTVCTRS